MTGCAAAKASTAAALSLFSMALTTFLRAVRTMERALTLRRRRCSDWRARFFADLMLAKVELRNELLGWKKTAIMRAMSRSVNSLALSRRPEGARPPNRAAKGERKDPIMPRPRCHLAIRGCHTTRLSVPGQRGPGAWRVSPEQGTT